MEKIKLLGNKVLVEVISDTKTASGLELVQTGDVSDFKKGKIVAVGQGKKTEDLTNKCVYWPMSVSVGDEILFNYGQEVLIDGQKYSLLGADDIILVFEK